MCSVVFRGLSGEALKEPAEGRGLGEAEVVTDLLHGHIRTGCKQTPRLGEDVFINIFAGRQPCSLLDDEGEMPRREMDLLRIERNLMLLAVMHCQLMAEVLKHHLITGHSARIIVQLATTGIGQFHHHIALRYQHLTTQRIEVY